MRYEENFNRDSAMMLSAGMALPEPWRNPPILEPSNTWYMGAFSDLSTCRMLGFSAGPIPWTVIQEYCDREKIHEERDVFVILIRMMDVEYLKFLKEESDK